MQNACVSAYIVSNDELKDMSENRLSIWLMNS